MKNKKIYFIILIIAFILIVTLSIDFKTQSPFSSYGIAYTDISIQSDSLHINGILTSSGSYYEKYGYEIKENKVYLSLYEGTIIFGKKYGKVDILIQDDFSKVEEIYQLDSNGSYDLIWSKDKGMEKL